MNENTILRTVPAANDLHKVPGFDPMKSLRKLSVSPWREMWMVFLQLPLQAVRNRYSCFVDKTII